MRTYAAKDFIRTLAGGRKMRSKSPDAAGGCGIELWAKDDVRLCDPGWDTWPLAQGAMPPQPWAQGMPN